MMQETLELVTPVPKLKSFWHKSLQYMMGIFLDYGAFIIAAIMLLFFHWYIALSTLLVTYLVVGIISSKLVHHFIPLHQQELNYSSFEISAWMIDALWGEKDELLP